ncbi:MAG TPA: DUF1499 domain-containing protein [Parvibaculum sp.]
MNEQSRFAAWGLRIGIAALVIVAAAIALAHFEIIPSKLAIAGIALSALVGLLAALISLAGIVVTLAGRKTGTLVAIIGLAIGLAAAVPVGTTMVKGSKVPPIHDITTDLSNAPQFVAIAKIREDAKAPNALDRLAPPNLADLQKEAYPDLATLDVAEQPGKVFEAAQATAQEMGWQIVASTPETGLIEATDTTKLIHFKDDIAIRVAEKDGGTAVDVRSVSRIGMSDLGVNAARIRAYLAALKAKLATPAS